MAESNQNQITFFDIPDKNGRTWSLNPWKTRFALNYKSLPYHTSWTEYPLIAPTLSPHLPPATPPPSTTSYTIPAIRFPDDNGGTYLMDSKKIAIELERRYPSPQYPSLGLDSPVLEKLEAIMPRLLKGLYGVFVPGVVKRVLGEGSKGYFKETREEAFGMGIDELEAKQGGERVYEEVIGNDLKEVTRLLKENGKGEGPFFEGDKVTYADFVWAGFLLFIRGAAGEEGWGKLLEATGDREAHEKLLKAVEPWARDDI
ncbi:hypothetical protein B0T20DRAFT_45410 [Sordaria brevicollis]|uniref:GST N-terminal domain-containing protein n=1 Tax=Sordaria brevicollis TaxID=83679 RepID=A0AAE0P9E4_SORBR|nr:hypothetical protein B0T20DRAFT_45410 [Sordaria brevicollis]